MPLRDLDEEQSVALVTSWRAAGWGKVKRDNGLSHLKPKEFINVEIDPEGILFFDRATDLRLDIQ